MLCGAVICLLALVAKGIDAGSLSIQGNYFYKGGSRVFLSGTNQAWVSYAYDFGNNQYAQRRGEYERILDELQQAGGNSIRIWVHIEGQTSPHFTGSGMVDGTDEGGTLISDLREYLRAAAQRDILIFITLWNGAAKGNTHDRLDGLIKDTSKLQSYIDNALIPMVTALKDEPGLGGWDVMNEPGGEMIPGESSSNPCDDTSQLQNSGMGWEGKLYTAREIQRFLNWQADAIHQADPSALVSVGVWNPIDNTDAFGLNDLFKDECLTAAGGKSRGTMDYYQYHSYAWQGSFDGHSPFEHDFSAFQVSKPIIIGEFREADSAGRTIEEMYDWAYNSGYAGAWAWSVTDGPWDNILKGVRHISSYSDQSKGGLVGFSV